MDLFYENRPLRYNVAEACPFAYQAHVHDAVEILFPLEGTYVLSVSGNTYEVHPGEGICVFPMLVHSYESPIGQVRGLAVIMIPDLINEFSKAFHTSLPEKPVVRITDEDKEMRDVVNRLYDLRDQPEHPLSVAYVHLLVACTISKLRLVPLNSMVEMDLTHQIMQYITDHLNENLTLQSVSREVGVSRSHLSHIFSQRLHINFRHFINSMRIDQACMLLQSTPLSIKEICYRCGYENSRTFHRTFLAEYGITPGEYRKTRSPEGLRGPGAFLGEYGQRDTEQQETDM